MDVGWHGDGGGCWEGGGDELTIDEASLERDKLQDMLGRGGRVASLP